MLRTVYILLPVHNRCAVTKRFIDCLAAQSYRSYHLILIDDGSTDGTAEMAQAGIGEITVLKGTGDLWWAGSLQRGIRWLDEHAVAGNDVVLIANDDITFDTDFLEKAVGILDGMHSTLLLPYLRDEKTGAPKESGIEVDLRKFVFKQATSPARINCLSTRGLFMRMADLRRIGKFHPRMLPHYWSDYEFTIRAHRKGIDLRTSAELIVCLDYGQTGYRDFEDTHFVRFLRKYFSKKSVLNPVYRSAFIVLACPWVSIPGTLLQTWRDAFSYVGRRLRLALRLKVRRIRMKMFIRRQLNDLNIILGAGSTQQNGWISIDYPLLDLADPSTFAALFIPGSVSNFSAEHIWEHLSLEDGKSVSNTCFSYLKRGGKLRIAVPDGFRPGRDDAAQVRSGRYGAGADGHKVLYNYRTLSALLENAGYRARLLEWFDEDGMFHCENSDASDGLGRQSTRSGERHGADVTAYASLVVDAIKP